MNLHKKDKPSDSHSMICKHEAAWKALLVVLGTKSEWNIKQIFSEITMIELRFETGAIGDIIDSFGEEDTKAAMERLREQGSSELPK